MLIKNSLISFKFSYLPQFLPSMCHDSAASVSSTTQKPSNILERKFNCSSICERQHHHHHWRDSPLWALAFLRIVRHSSPFNATLLQFFTPKILMSCHTHSSHLNLGLPTFLAPSGLVLSTFLTNVNIHVNK
jgi:hypothetical protein